MRISDWSSDVCSSDLDHAQIGLIAGRKDHGMIHAVKVLERVLTFPMALISAVENAAARRSRSEMVERILASLDHIGIERHAHVIVGSEQDRRSEEHTSELQSLMRNSYAVFCLKKKNE